MKCDELRGKYMVVTGVKPWSTTPVCDYRVIGALYLKPDVELIPEAIKYVLEQDPRWTPQDKVDAIYHNMKDMRLFNGMKWSDALIVEHYLFHNWFGFIPAENVLALFEPTEQFRLNTVT
jgi:hypothetical protein